MLDFFRVTPKKRTLRLKKKSGIVYSNPGSFKRMLFLTGNFLFLMAMLFLFYLYWPLTKALVVYRLNTNKTTRASNREIIKTITDEELKSNQINDKSYWVQIPKILARADVVVNVSPFNQKEYSKVLSNNVIAQAAGTDVPGGGKGKSTFIFAHSSQEGISMVRNNSVFYLLGELSNDDVIIIDYKGKIYTYQIYDKKIVSPYETSYINYKKYDEEILILQTCWPIGTDWRRLLVFAKRL